MRRHRLLTRTAPVALAATALALSACGGSTAASARATLAPSAREATTSTTQVASSAGAASAPTPKVTKLLVVVEENHSLSQMKAGMPYTFGLAEKYGYATHYTGLAHPSLPNYLAIAGGSTFGVTDDEGPSAHPLPGHSVFGQAVAHDKTAALYAQSMPSACAIVNDGAYAVRHNPWTYFTADAGSCATHDLPGSRLRRDIKKGRLPRVGMLVPDLQHDAHSASLESADAWFETKMTSIFAGPDWKSGHLAVVLSADEDDRNHDNRVLTVVIHPSQDHHVVKRALDHYSLTRLYDEVAHLPKLRRAEGATSMATAFGLPVG